MRVSAALLLALALATTPARAAPVLMISVDGLRPADILGAKERGLKVPTLRRMIADGAYAEAVTGVLPTLTYPSHVTLITGAAPARHGIGNNLSFDPLFINREGWEWYAEDIRTPTLWSAARTAGLKVANVHWPVSVGAPADANLPQVWRTGHEDDRKLMRALATPGLLARLEAALGPYAQGIAEDLAADEVRVRLAERLIAEQRPALTTVYLASVDHVEHAFGPGSREALAAIAANDAMIGRIAASARAAEPDVTVLVVSDHGFRALTTDVNILAPFVASGLVTLDAQGKPSDWLAEPWFMGGAAGIVLRQPDDEALVARVRTFLAGLAADPDMAIDEVIERSEIARRDGDESLSFLITFKPGFEAGHDPRAPKQSPSSYKGMHGYAPSDPAMAASLFVDGPGLRRHGDLGRVDMRAIAPAVARILGVALPGAELPPAF